MIAVRYLKKNISWLVVFSFLVGAVPCWAEDSQLVLVTADGQRLSESLALGAMLSKEPSVRAKPINMGVEIAGLHNVLPAADANGVWTYASYRWGGAFVGGQFKFNGFIGGVPDHFRIAVYRPSQEKIYLSNEVQTHPLLNRYHVDLLKNGKAVLTRSDTGKAMANAVLGLADLGLLSAMVLVLVTEGMVVIAGVMLLKKKKVLVRVAGGCIAVNAFAFPMVWALAHAGFWFGGLWVGLGFLLLQLTLAVLLQGTAYALLGRFDWRRGVAIGLIAKIAAGSLLFVIGYCVFA